MRKTANALNTREQGKEVREGEVSWLQTGPRLVADLLARC